MDPVFGCQISMFVVPKRESNCLNGVGKQRNTKKPSLLPSFCVLTTLLWLCIPKQLRHFSTAKSWLGWLCCADARGPLSCPAPAGIIIDTYTFLKNSLVKFWQEGGYDLGKKVLMELEFTAYLPQPIFLPNNILTSTRPAYFNCQIHLFHSIKTIGFIQWGCPLLSRFKCFKLLMNQLYGSKIIKCLFVQGTTKYWMSI